MMLTISSVPLITMLSILVVSVNSQTSVKSYRNAGRIVFPDEFEESGEMEKRSPKEYSDGSCCSGEQELPLDLAMKLSQVMDEKNFYSLLDEKSVDNRVFSNNSDNEFQTRFGMDVERSPGTKPKPAGCNTEQTIVPLRPENDTDPTLIYYPACTRVARCSGCCFNKLLACQPTSSRDLLYEVLISQYVNGNKLKFRGKDIVIVEEHLSCACSCRTKESDCDLRFQKYNSRNCRCECVNTDERNKCLLENDTKHWNPQACRCECRDVQDCTTGSYYEHNSCKCIQNSIYYNY